MENKITTKELESTINIKDYTALLTALNQTALVSITDTSGNITYANDKFVEVSKYTLNELIGQNHRILKSGHQPDTLFVDLWKTIASSKVWRGEIKNKAKDGSYYWVDTSIAPILNDEGKPERYIAIRFLISDKKDIEKDLMSQMEKLEKMNKFMIDRELKMLDLKQKISDCKVEKN